MNGALAEFQLLEELESAGSLRSHGAPHCPSSGLPSPTVASIPKDAHGNLDHMVVCYTLRRIFVDKHSWYVQEFTPSGSAQNELLPLAMVQG